MPERPIDRRHADYLANQSLWAYYELAFQGGPNYASAVNPLGSTTHTRLLLTQYRRESDEVFKDRLAKAVCYNICGPVVDFYAATVGKQEQSIFQVDGQFEVLRDDVDLRGKNWLQWAETARRHAAVYGHTFVFVDSRRPAAPVITRADEQRLGLRPYVFEIKPPDMLNWRFDPEGKLEEILFRVPVPPSAGLMAPEAEKPAVEYVHWTRSEWAKYRKQGDGKVIQVDAGRNPLGVVPLAVLYHAEDKPMVGKSLLRDSSKVQQRLLNMDSQMNLSFELQMFPQLTLKSNSPASEYTVGPNQMVALREEESLEYLAPPTDTYEASWTSFYRLIAWANQQMGLPKASAVSDSGGAADQQSGVSKAWDYVEAEKIMARMALNEQEVAKQVFAFAGMWMGQEFSGEIAYSSKYDLRSLADEIADLLALQAAGAPPAARRELLRQAIRHALPSLSAETAAAIDKELEAVGTVEPMNQEPNGEEEDPQGNQRQPDSAGR